MAATRTVITKAQAERMEFLVESARACRDAIQAYTTEIAEKIVGPEAKDFLPDVIAHDHCTLAWMLERLGVEVAAAPTASDACDKAPRRKHVLDEVGTRCMWCGAEMAGE